MVPLNFATKGTKLKKMQSYKLCMMKGYLAGVVKIARERPWA